MGRFIKSWRDDMADMKKAREQAERIEQRIEDDLKDMGKMGVDLKVTNTKFINRSLMVSNRNATMHVCVEVDLKFKV